MQCEFLSGRIMHNPAREWNRFHFCIQQPVQIFIAMGGSVAISIESRIFAIESSGQSRLTRGESIGPQSASDTRKTE